MRLNSGFLAAAALVGWAFAVAPSFALETGYYRYPASSGEYVVFTSEGDLWRAPVSGGLASRLTTHLGQETRASVSPDGKTVAFSASFEGPTEVYAMPILGGLPKRLTFEGETAFVVGWTPKGDVLYSTARFSGLPARQLATVNPVSLKKALLPVDKSTDAAVGAKGNLVFSRNGLRSDNVRAYRGGSVSQLWAMDLNDKAEATVLTLPKDGNNSSPMLWGEHIYFLSDRSGTQNVWRMNVNGSNPVAMTQHPASGFEVRQAQLHSGRIVYTLGADIRTLDLATRQDRALSVALSTDFEQRRERWVSTPLRNFTSAAVSPNGEQVVVTARGHVVVAGTGDLRRVNLPLPSGTRAHAAQFGHDGKQILMFSDGSDEMEVTQWAANGSGSGKAMTTDGKTVRTGMAASPDGKWLLHKDHDFRLYLTQLATQKTELIDDATAAHGDLVWAPDSSAFVFTRPLGGRRGNGVLWMMRLSDRQKTALSTDRYDVRSPAFTPDNKWLYFVSDRHLVATPGSPWGSRNMGVQFDKRDRIYALALQTGLVWPFAPRDELTIPPASPPPPGASSASIASAASLPASASAPSANPVRAPLPTIEVEGLAERLYEVPANLVPAANVARLRTDGRRLFYLELAQAGALSGQLKSLALDANATPAELHSEASTFDLSANGRKLMIVRRSEGQGGAPGNVDIALMDAVAKPPAAPAELARTVVRLSDWQVLVDPKKEWEQLFADAWRMHRNYFYDANMHGTDWVAARKKYLELLPRVSDRNELADLMAQMVAEVRALHSQVGSGDVRLGAEQVTTGALGAQLSQVAGGWRIDKIYASEFELPTERGPLARPGLDVRVGDVIAQVNFRDVKQTPDLGDALRGQVGKQVILGLLRDGVQKSVMVIPTTAARERSLRTSDWELANRLKVEKASDNNLGYLRLRAMSAGDLATFAREFYPVHDRDGLIIDVRGNGGGSIDSILIEKLMRRAWSFWQSRKGGGDWNMQNAFRGQMVVLIDEDTYSDGETFSEGMKRLGLATLIGKRTAGAGVWLSDRNRLADGGIARAAESGQFTLDGTWLVESTGVSPDIEVANMPRATFNGGDAQLDAAIAHLQRELAAKPVPKVQIPAIPKR